MKNDLLLRIILIFFSIADVNAMQENDSLKLKDIEINKILIAGNEITDEDIITREIHTKENSKIDPIVLNEDVQRIYNLGLFNKVDVYPIPVDSLGKVNLMFLVEERFYILPVPQGGFRNGEFSKFWAGLNIVWNNFRGRNETASLSFGLFYEPFVNASYFVPWIGEKAHFFSSASIGYSKSYNKSLLALNDSTTNSIPASTDNFIMNNFNSSFSLGKYFTDNFSVTGNLRFNLISSSQYEPGRTISKDGKDEYFTLGFSGKFDTRNSLEYTTAGSFYFLEYQKIGFGKLVDFNRTRAEYRKFIPVKLGKKYFITLASRGITTISFGGDIPDYLHEFFGYDKIIRGYKKKVFEGENQLGMFNEIRIPVIEPFYLKGKSMPVVNVISMLKNLSYKFGLYGTVFYDIGGVWNKKDKFIDTRFYHGFGAGLNFILPFGFVFRTDYAFRREGKKFVPQVIFDLDAAF